MALQVTSNIYTCYKPTSHVDWFTIIIFFRVSNELAPTFHVFKLLMVECNRRIQYYPTSGPCVISIMECVKQCKVVFFSFPPHFCIKVTLFCLSFPVLLSYILSIIVRSIVYKPLMDNSYPYYTCIHIKDAQEVAKLLVKILQSYKVC